MKRLRSQIASLQHLLDEAIRVDLISEPLCYVGPDDDGRDVAAKLTKEGFDECGLSRNGMFREFVRLSELKPISAGLQAIPVPIERNVAPTTPLWTCMNQLPSNGPLYVLRNDGLSDIVTVADLNKQPFRLLKLGIVSILEMALLHMVNATYPNPARARNARCRSPRRRSPTSLRR